MLIDRRHRNWIVFTVAATAVAWIYYAYYAHAAGTNGGTGPSGSTWPGLIYGTLAFLLMCFCGLLGARKTVRVWRLGRAETWLRAHIWLGLLVFPLVLFHSAGLWGHYLTFWLMLLLSIVLLSGIIGVLLQQIVPRSMLEMVKAECTFEQIPHVIEVLQKEALTIATQVCGPVHPVAAPAAIAETAGGGGTRSAVKTEGRVQGVEVKHVKGKPIGPLPGSLPLKNFYVDEIEPFLGQRFLKRSALATAQRASAVFEHTNTLLPENLHEALNDLKSVCEERRQLALQAQLHRWLHLWEYVHVPLSYMLLALSAYHIVIATFAYSGVLHK